MLLRRSLNTWRKLRSALFAVSDQFIYSAGQQLLSVMLARALSPKDFGAASAVLAIIAFQYILHCAFVHEPLLITRRFADRSTALICCGVVVSGTLLILCISAAFDSSKQWSWAAVAIVTTSEVFWLFRTLETSTRRFGTLCLYGLAVCVSYWLLLKLCSPKDWTFSLYLVSFAQCPFLILVVLRFHTVLNETVNGDDKGLKVKQSIEYGIQAAFSQLSSWIMTGGTIILLGYSADPMQGGLLKIYITLLLPMQYVLAALGYYMLPKLSLDWSLGKCTDTYRVVGLFVLFGLLAAEAFGLVIYFVGPRVVTVVFGKDYAFMDLSPFLYAPPVFALTMCLRTAFRATGQLTGMLTCSLIGAAAFTLCVILGGNRVSYLQAVICMTVGFAVTAATMVCWLAISARRSRLDVVSNGESASRW